MNTPNHPWSSVPGPEDIARGETSNGIVVLARENFQSPSVVVSGYLLSGSMYDPEDLLGLAMFTSRCLMHGTQNHTQGEIYEALEGIGAGLGFGAGVHSATFGGRALAEDLPVLLDLLAESLMLPVFPEIEVERLRAQMLTALAIREQDTEQRASLAFEKLIYARHPYGRPEDGYQQTVSQIRRADLLRFHEDHYAPQGMVISVVGAVPRMQVLEEVQKRLGSWVKTTTAEPIFPDFQALEKPVREHISLAEKYQTDIVLGTLGPARSAEDYLAASLGNHILGQFGMMGRIGESVRERAGLAYYASSSLTGGLLGGSWEVDAGVNPENVDQAIALIQKELSAFVEEPVSGEEISDSVSNLVGQIPLWLESNNGVASALLRMERFDLGLDYYRRYPGLLKAITPEDILITARKYLDLEHLAVVSAGPPVE
jgi:zinc protease